MNCNLTIAIDGPAGAGKSTIARILAQRLNIMYLDTGAMYRAVALKALKNNVDPLDHEKVISLLTTTDISIEYDNGYQRILLDGQDVTNSIRTPEVSKVASDVAKIPEVRIKLVKLQRMIAARYSLVMDGRDIGTYVLPDASNKFFLTATPEERARRRWKEIIKSGRSESFDDVLKEILQRDLNDSNRSFAPLRKANDAILVDTTNKSISEVADEIIHHIQQYSLRG